MDFSTDCVPFMLPDKIALCMESSGFPGGSSGKESACQEIRVRSLGQEDILEWEMGTRSSILAWEIPGQMSLAGYSPWSCKESDKTDHAHTHRRRACLLQAQFQGLDRNRLVE